MIVYTHTRLDSNEIFYVGIGKTEKRAYSKHGRNNYWKRIVAKVGYSIQIVHECETWDEACYSEKYLIGYYGRHDLGLGTLCNLTVGGEGIIGLIFTDEHRAKLSKVRKNISDETRDKMSASAKIRHRTPHSEETIAKMRYASTNISDEHRAKLRASHQNISDETRAKLSEARKRRSFKLSPEHLEKLRLSHLGVKSSPESIAKRVATRKANSLLKNKI